jgi:hypothetical protein
MRPQSATFQIAALASLDLEIPVSAKTAVYDKLNAKNVETEQ